MNITEKRRESCELMLSPDAALNYSGFQLGAIHHRIKEPHPLRTLNADKFVLHSGENRYIFTSVYIQPISVSGNVRLNSSINSSISSKA